MRFQFALSKFRCNSFSLCVDIGKFKNMYMTMREDYKCIFCQGNNPSFIEGKLHVLFVCNKNTTI